MKKEELIVGEIYYTSLEDGTNSHIFKFIAGKFSYCRNLCINNNRFTDTMRGFSDYYDKCLRLATQEEKNWLNTCINANKFIPFDEVNQSINYEIY